MNYFNDTSSLIYAVDAEDDDRQIFKDGGPAEPL
jgi:hypothetical protein